LADKLGGKQAPEIDPAPSVLEIFSRDYTPATPAFVHLPRPIIKNALPAVQARPKRPFPTSTLIAWQRFAEQRVMVCSLNGLGRI
jgi:hypothetical protein